MGSFSDYAENKVLELIVGKTAFATPTAYIALCTADPTDAGTGASMNEVTNTAAYARVATAGGDWDAAAAGAIANATAIEFIQASGNWSTVTHFALVDSGTYGAGNMLAHGALTASKAVTSGDTVIFAIGDLSATLD
jgi:hypothetical protein